jgi:hypothetical protein
VFVNRKWKLCDKVVEAEINCLDIIVIKSGKGNVKWRGEVLRENKECVIEFKDCDTTDGFKGKKRWEEDKADCVDQEGDGERLDCTGVTGLCK